MLYFNATENCGYNCSQFFEEIAPKEGPVEVYVEKQNGQVFIAGNDNARQMEVYIQGDTKEVHVRSKGELEITTTKRFKKTSG